jgi:hypothetical protein
MLRRNLAQLSFRIKSFRFGAQKKPIGQPSLCQSEKCFVYSNRTSPSKKTDCATKHGIIHKQQPMNIILFSITNISTSSPAQAGVPIAIPRRSILWQKLLASRHRIPTNNPCLGNSILLAHQRLRPLGHRHSSLAIRFGWGPP